MEELVQRVGVKGGGMVLIKDCVACRGSFMLHYLLKKLLGDTSARVLFVGLSEPLTHYSRIARKQGCNLQTWQDSGRFVFVQQQFPIPPRTGAEVSDAGTKASLCDENALAALYVKMRKAAVGMRPKSSKQSGEPLCIMIDDASLLDVIAGGSHNSVLDFLHYCQAISSGGKRCSIILLTHQDVYEEAPESYMSLELEYAADTVLSVEPLSTGLASDVHGQLTILHRTEQLENPGSEVNPRSRLQKFQFRILENTVLFFLPGQL